MQISETTKIKLDRKAMLVESNHFKDVIYAIDREGQGMWLLAGGKEVAISDPVTLVMELFEVWQHIKPRECKL